LTTIISLTGFITSKKSSTSPNNCSSSNVSTCQSSDKLSRKWLLFIVNWKIFTLLDKWLYFTFVFPGKRKSFDGNANTTSWGRKEKEAQRKDENTKNVGKTE